MPLVRTIVRHFIFMPVRGACTFSGRVGMLGRQWFNIGNATRSGRDGPPTAVTDFSTEDVSSFGLFGVNLQAGVEF